MLSYGLTLRIPIWAAPPTTAAYRELYAALQSQLGLNRLETPGAPPSCLMSNGNALLIQIAADQGLFHCLRNLEAPEGADEARDLEVMTRDFLVALSETRKALRPVLFVAPVAQIRAIWEVTTHDSVAFLRAMVGDRLRPEGFGTGMVLGFHLVQPPTQAPNPMDASAAELRIEPFLRATSSIWIEATYQYPAAMIPGSGVVAQGLTGASVPADVSKVWECAMKARELLYQVPAFLGQGGDSG